MASPRVPPAPAKADPWNSEPSVGSREAGISKFPESLKLIRTVRNGAEPVEMYLQFKPDKAAGL